MTTIASHIIAVCWAIFIIVWLVNAARTKRTVENQSLASALAHRLPVGLGWWLMLVPKWRIPFNRQILPHTKFLQMTGAVICVAGLLFTLWARQTLAGNWSANVTFKQDHELIRTGPYHIVRHQFTPACWSCGSAPPFTLESCEASSACCWSPLVFGLNSARKNACCSAIFPTPIRRTNTK